MRDCLVLIPGTLCDARVFAKQVQTLRRTWQVIVLDFRRLRDLRDWPQQVLRNLPARFHLAGFSLGGIWALELLRQAPQRIEGLALIASNAEPGSQRNVRRSASLWRLWRQGGPDPVARQLKHGYFHHAAVRWHHAQLVRDMARSTTARAARAEFQWAACRPPSLDVLSRFEKPTLIVSGAQDHLCPRSLQQRMSDVQPHARWIELQRCGHFIPLEQPSALTRLLSHWLLLSPANAAHGSLN